MRLVEVKDPRTVLGKAGLEFGSPSPLRVTEASCTAVSCLPTHVALLPVTPSHCTSISSIHYYLNHLICYTCF